MKSRYFFIVLLGASLLISGTGCKKLVDVPPPVTELTGNNVFINNATAIAVLTGIYNSMSSGNSFAAGGNSISVYAGLSADELLCTANNSTNTLFYTNSLNSRQTNYGGSYQNIYQVNAAIAGLTSSTTLTPAVQQELIGEAKFLRALNYFYITNAIGDAPLALTNDYTITDKLARAPQAQVYQQIIADLTDAQKLLSKNYLMADVQTAYPATIASQERVRPNYYAATALLARVYLYTKDYQDAITQSSAIISNTSYYSLASLNNAFLKASLGNPEAIWQLQPTYYYTPDGNFFVLTAPPTLSGVWLSNNLLNTFEPGDQRKVNWISSYTGGGQTYYFPYKYKVYTGTSSSPEYSMVLRLGEQYLIRAEAEAQLGQTGPAATDLNVIRTRAGLPNTTANTQNTLLGAILHERQVELFTEWGHRWLDLKRTGNVNAVMGSPGNVCQQKGGTWSPNWALWPIPQSDILLDPALIQNPGY
ncbi:RagB/SusD family nutrient uptake outer membrane protein [Mucilaginibacter sp. X4EP1]|uniref:RagB/SusD family nutrient uptake outer membrane protein n=1 Tax=Mucilaginibacter sp. X4EP1 TaxID=2723092 RepID=UPI00216A6992|nr:RagB/SusD family nutrient uptake outer membrane protein [Mucilaginibacter sp. X4EP1]MCS3815487.1 hypothetical protein [Mucilaginibacter sp. X4EP1]